jgi:hypothetical protein
VSCSGDVFLETRSEMGLVGEELVDLFVCDFLNLLWREPPWWWCVRLPPLERDPDCDFDFEHREFLDPFDPFDAPR